MNYNNKNTDNANTNSNISNNANNSNNSDNSLISIDNSILYSHDDIAPINCNDCRGCSKCCKNMGDSIIQDPYDLWLFSKNMRVSGAGKITFDLLISEDGPWIMSEQNHLLLPSLKMVDNGVCPFINASGRCSIHAYRSGLCRLFPLARVFQITEEPQNNGNLGSERLDYYVLPKEFGCHRAGKSGDGIRVSDWLAIPDIDKYETFQLKWHGIKNSVKNMYSSLDADKYTSLQDMLIEVFYRQEYSDDFYSDFDKRASVFIKLL